MDNSIIIKNLDKFYDKFQILKNINLEIKKGSFVVILGQSGAGKSTFLNILGGLEPFENGNIKINGQENSKLNKKQLEKYRRNNFSYVFQFYNLIESLTVLENIQIIKQEFKTNIDCKSILLELDIPEEFHNKFPGDLSGGQQQRVAIARALVKDAEYILCDEPTGALDSKNSDQVINILKNLTEKYKKTVVIVTHNEEYRKIADQVIVFKDGEVISQ